MQRTAIILACFFICVNCFSQQYPFVHYTPKDGLISNSIRNIYQDRKGRLYFTSINGLSVYDGTRFHNYSSRNGLSNDIVNCVIEMGEDSTWIVTNDGKIQCLVNSKLKPIILNSPPPLIDNLIRDEKGSIYAASEQGLYLFHGNRFIKLPFTDIRGRDIGSYIGNIAPSGKYLLVVRDNTMLDIEERNILYLYDIEARKIIEQTQKEIIFYLVKAPDGRIWVSTNKKIQAIDTNELKNGKIVFQKLQPPFDKIEKSGLNYLNFDQNGNCWLTDKVSVLKKLGADGNLVSFTTVSGLSTIDVSNVFQDKEGTTWIATFSGGVDKLVHSNFSISAGAFGISAINCIAYSADKDQLLLYSPHNAKAIISGENDLARVFDVKDANKFENLFITPKGLFGFNEHDIYKLMASGNKLYPKIIFTDTTGNVFVNPLVDKNGNFIMCGKYYLTAVLDGNTIYRKKINYFVDHAALDATGNIWITNRAGELIRYEVQSGDPSNYLGKEIMVSKKLNDISPRSIIIDKKNNIWIGSRNDGIHVFKFQNENLTRQFYLNAGMGLSDNFITQLACDGDNTIWACSSSGLDKITIRNEKPVIENLTKQNNIYQKIEKVVIDKKNNVWAIISNGLVKITREDKKTTGYSPALMVSMIKSGKDTIKNEAGTTLSHKQNNLSFYFAATSFLDEKQVLYSYRLIGGSNTQWSDPSNNSTVSFIDLPAGDYTLDIKANFPAGRYPEQTIQYKFSITPPWWQAWWFRVGIGIFGIGTLVAGIRFYYRRTLEKEKAILEKQQAVEKERTRIATDMHDDFGAGLSRIKFLSQALINKEENAESIKSALEKITVYSDEMTEKMGDIVWALNEKNDTLADLVAYTRTYVLEYLTNHNISCNVNTPMPLPGTFIAGEIRRNIFLSVKECLHNVVKHADASQVYFSIQLNGRIEIVIHDNGKGIDWNNQRAFSNGIQNIKKRMSDINGNAEFLNEQGTKVLLNVPLAL